MTDDDTNGRNAWLDAKDHRETLAFVIADTVADDGPHLDSLTDLYRTARDAEQAAWAAYLGERAA